MAVPPMPPVIAPLPFPGVEVMGGFPLDNAALAVCVNAPSPPPSLLLKWKGVLLIMTPISCRGGSEGGFQGEEVPQNASPPYLPALINPPTPPPLFQGLGGGIQHLPFLLCPQGGVVTTPGPGKGGNSGHNTPPCTAPSPTRPPSELPGNIPPFLSRGL